MYTYEYEHIYLKGVFSATMKEHREIIEQRAGYSWRYAGFVPVKQTGDGCIVEIDLIFEKEV